MAMDMFIEIGDIKGESKDKVHKEKIDVLAWSWGMANSSSGHHGGGSGSGKVNVQDLSFTKWIDKSSPVLMLSCCKGTHHDKAKLIVRKAGDTPLEYLVIEMEEVTVSAVSTGGSGGEDRLTENVTISFDKFKVGYTEQAPKGAKQGGAIEAEWTISENA